ncbi:MAG: hypothetical protein MOGMAGMI_01775 [Candidatus Omnitrophica bacterium]|nr:hypothetical protein [Candidatus Omnitrophota bacterium]
MRCRRCVLTDRVPHVTFERGVCSVCRQDPRRTAPAERAEVLGRFRAALDRRRAAPGGADVLLAYSGGKDSSYALDILSRRLGLRVLAYTFDNGYVPRETWDNARRLTDRLAGGWIVYRPAARPLKRVLRASLDKPLHPAKSLERASPVCLSCIGIVKYTALRLAQERGIPYVAFGWTPGQAPVSRAYLELDARMVQAMQEPLRTALERAAGTDLSEWFMAAPAEGRVPAMVHPAAFYPYDEGSIYRRLSLLGWRRPQGLDPNSTNCRLNTLNVYEHLKRHGYHPYIHELASLVRQGHLGRAEALRRLGPVNAAAARSLGRSLGR